MLAGRLPFILFIRPEARLLSERMKFFYGLIGLFLSIWFVSTAARMNARLDPSPGFCPRARHCLVNRDIFSKSRSGTWKTAPRG